MRDDRNESRNGVVNKAHRGKAGGDPISVDIYSSSEFLAAKFGPVWGRTHSGFNYLSHLAFNHVWHQTGDFEAKIQTNCM